MMKNAFFNKKQKVFSSPKNNNIYETKQKYSNNKKLPNFNGKGWREGGRERKRKKQKSKQDRQY